MAQRINRLNARKVASLRRPGLHADGAGLYLRISQGRHTGKRWVLVSRRPRDSKRCEIGLGSALTVSFAAMHTAAANARARLADGLGAVHCGFRRSDSKPHRTANNNLHCLKIFYLRSG